MKKVHEEFRISTNGRMFRVESSDPEVGIWDYEAGPFADYADALADMSERERVRGGGWVVVYGNKIEGIDG